MSLTETQERVLRLLWDLEWHDGWEITAPNIGGSEGLRRLRELRAKGAPIDMRRKTRPNGEKLATRQYRLTVRWFPR